MAAEEEQLNMKRARKWPKRSCYILKMDQQQFVKCVRNTRDDNRKMIRLGKRTGPGKTGKRDKMFMIRAGKRG